MSEKIVCKNCKYLSGLFCSFKVDPITGKRKAEECCVYNSNNKCPHFKPTFIYKVLGRFM